MEYGREKQTAAKDTQKVAPTLGQGKTRKEMGKSGEMLPTAGNV